MKYCDNPHYGPTTNIWPHGDCMKEDWSQEQFQFIIDKIVELHNGILQLQEFDKALLDNLSKLIENNALVSAKALTNHEKRLLKVEDSVSGISEVSSMLESYKPILSTLPEMNNKVQSLLNIASDVSTLDLKIEGVDQKIEDFVSQLVDVPEGVSALQEKIAELEDKLSETSESVQKIDTKVEFIDTKTSNIDTEVTVLTFADDTKKYVYNQTLNGDNYPGNHDDVVEISIGSGTTNFPGTVNIGGAWCVFKGCKVLRWYYSSNQSVSWNTFMTEFPALEDVYFSGTIEESKNIFKYTKGVFDQWKPLKDAIKLFSTSNVTVIHCIDGDRDLTVIDYR